MKSDKDDSHRESRGEYEKRKRLRPEPVKLNDRNRDLGKHA